MSKRITISVPNEMYEYIQDNKDFINISQVCQRAFEKSIKETEQRKKLYDQGLTDEIKFNKTELKLIKNVCLKYSHWSAMKKVDWLCGLLETADQDIWFMKGQFDQVINSAK